MLDVIVYNLFIYCALNFKCACFLYSVRTNFKYAYFGSESDLRLTFGC